MAWEVQERAAALSARPADLRASGELGPVRGEADVRDSLRFLLGALGCQGWRSLATSWLPRQEAAADSATKCRWGGARNPGDPGGPHGEPAECRVQGQVLGGAGQVGVEKEMKGAVWGTKGEGGEDRLSIWKITAVSWLLLLQSRDESSAGCLGNSYFPPAADQFHLHKCPVKL